MSGYLGLDVFAILTSLFILVGSPDRDITTELFSIVPHQLGEDTCGQSVVAGLSGHYPEKTGRLSLLDMEEALLGSGIQSRPVELKLEELLPLARRNYPVVILLSKPTWHYALLIGESTEMLVIADPSEGTIALEISRLSKRFSGWAIVPLLNDDEVKHISAELEVASNAALGRASMIRRKLNLEIANAGQGMGKGAGIKISLAQSLVIGQGLTFMAEVSSNPSASLELGENLHTAGAALEASIGLLIDDFTENPKTYAKVEGAVFRDPIAYFLGVRASKDFEASAGLIYAVNDKAAFEGGLRLQAEGWAWAKGRLGLAGGVHLAIGAVMCTILACTSLEGSGGNVTLAVNF